jgi:hypothetical protein
MKSFSKLIQFSCSGFLKEIRVAVDPLSRHKVVVARELVGRRRRITLGSTTLPH